MNYVPPILPVVTWARMRSAGASTWETPRKENRSSTRYFGGCSEVCLRMWPIASVTAAWKVTPPALSPARFTRTSWPGWKIASIGKCSRRAGVNARAQYLTDHAFAALGYRWRFVYERSEIISTCKARSNSDLFMVPFFGRKRRAYMMKENLMIGFAANHTAISTSRTRPSQRSGWECQGRRLSRARRSPGRLCGLWRCRPGGRKPERGRRGLEKQADSWRRWFGGQ